jgi:dihydroorotase
LLNLKGKGRLTVGYDADITLIDPNREEKVDAQSFQSKGKNSPFHGWTLQSWPVMTIYRGRVVMRDRQLLAIRAESFY